MKRKTLLAAAVSLGVLVTLATPRFSEVGAWCRPPSATETQVSTSFSIGKIFRAIFGGSKKKKAVDKISDKDIKKFEGSEVTRVNDAKTPAVAPLTPNADTGIDDRSLAERIQRGRELLNAGQLNEAITELTTAATLDPKAGEVHMLLGVAYDRKGLGGRARDEFETAAHDPNNQAMHLNNLGFLLYRQGEYDDAIKNLKKAAKLNPDDPRIWNNLVLVQLAAENFDDAYKSSVHVLGEFDSRVKIADRLQWHGRTKDAIKQLEKALQIRPDSAAVLSLLASLYDGSDQKEKAQSARQALASLQTVANTSTQK
jgi:Flp pilus assembly protein TadD